MNARKLSFRGAICCFVALGGPALVSADDQGMWSEFPPPRRQSAAAVYDPVRDRMLFFGGEYGTAYSPETWELRLGGTPIWTELAPLGSMPSPRFGSSAIYDPMGDRVIVFGGWDGGFRNDVWSLELSGYPTWTSLTPAGTPPSGRLWHSAIYDPLRERMLVFGGQGTGGAASDVWELSLSGAAVWSTVNPGGTGPSALQNHSALYDPIRDRMLVFGGSNGSTSSSSVWALDLAATPTWAQVLPSGTPPMRRQGHVAIYDPPRDRMLVFGGLVTFTQFFSDPNNDLWALSLAGAPAWTTVTADGLTPPPNYMHSAIYDPVRDRMVVHGGWANSGDAAVLDLAAGPTWGVIASPGLPHPSYVAAAIYDGPRQRLLVAGGFDGEETFGRASAFSLTGDPVWTAIDAAGVLPGPRGQHTVILDAPRDRMILFGGRDSMGIYHNDVWALSLGGTPSWTDLVPSGSPPPPREDHVAVYDPVRERMIVVGGQAPGKLNDVWALSLSSAPAWTHLFPSGAPPPGRTKSAAIYDPIRDRIILFGGLDVSSSGENDVWALSLSGTPTWTQLTPSGTPPSPRFWHRACYDPVRDRMVTFGGFSAPRDVWALNLAGSPTWVPLFPTHATLTGRYLHTLVYDTDRDRMIVFGGNGGGNLLKDVWSLRWGPAVGVAPEATVRGTELAPSRPVPARTTLTIPFSLSAAGMASLRVYDAGGRLVKSLENRILPAGRHVVEWDLRDEVGVPVPSGVYFYELRSVEERSARRFAVLR